jgi:hypothetical protein
VEQLRYRHQFAEVNAACWMYSLLPDKRIIRD